MNKRIIAMLLASIMLLAITACGKNADEAEAVTTTATTEESIPGVIAVPEGIKVDWDTETEATESVEETASVVETTAPSEETEKDPSQATAAPTTSPEEETTTPTTPAVQMTEFEWYNSLSGEEQMAYMESFDSIEAFFDWYNNAKAEHAEQRPDIEVGDGVIDLEDLIGGNG